MSLKDTLARLKGEEEQKTQWEEDKPKIIREWQAIVTNLLTEIRLYLSDYEKDGFLSFSPREIRLSEEGLGDYLIGAMSINAGAAKLMVDPVGTLIIGALGRVDIYRQGRSSEQDRMVLLRVKQPESNSEGMWKTFLPDEIGAPRTGILQTPARRLVPFTKEILEQRLELMLG